MSQEEVIEAFAPRSADPRFRGTRRYLTPYEAASYLGIGHSTLSIHRTKGTGPAYIKWSPMNVRYDILELDAWMAANRVTPSPRELPPGKRKRGRPRIHPLPATNRKEAGQRAGK
jgi:hypothetical protein